MEQLLTLKDVATLLQVSPQTLRKWDDKLKVIKTEGGHRRYNQKVIFDFMNNEKYERSVFYWPIDYYKYLAEREVEAIHSKWKDKADLSCGIWTEQCVAIILENQKSFSEFLETDFDIDRIKSKLSQIISPYLLGCTPLVDQNGLIFYKRDRGDKWVFESENYCCGIYDAGIDELNKLLIEDLINWSGTVYHYTCPENSLFDTEFHITRNASLRNMIDSVKAKILEKTNIDKEELSFSILTHPDNHDCLIKVLLHEDKFVLSGGSTDSLEYTSTYMPKDKVLIVAKPKSDYYLNGYVFSPFMVDLPSRTCMIRKLLREGSKMFGVINYVKEI